MNTEYHYLVYANIQIICDDTDLGQDHCRHIGEAQGPGEVETHHLTQDLVWLPVAVLSRKVELNQCAKYEYFL